MRALHILGVTVTVSDLTRAARFYVEALGFDVASGRCVAGAAFAGLLGANRVEFMCLRRGRQMLALIVVDPAGAPYPAESRANDGWFQHCALSTADIRASFARLEPFSASAISRDGPQALPGGIIAYKFRDPDGHPLELIQFPGDADPATSGGIDHTAIASADADRSITFYHDNFGLAVAARQQNTGPAQDALDGLDDTLVDVVALTPSQRALHLELLGYRSPIGRPAPPRHAGDIDDTTTIMVVDSVGGCPNAVILPSGARVAMLRDPDMHGIIAMAPGASGDTTSDMAWVWLAQ